jgi:hypothetical protein
VIKLANDINDSVLLLFNFPSVREYRAAGATGGDEKESNDRKNGIPKAQNEIEKWFGWYYRFFLWYEIHRPDIFPTRNGFWFMIENQPTLVVIDIKAFHGLVFWWWIKGSSLVWTIEVFCFSHGAADVLWMIWQNELNFIHRASDQVQNYGFWDKRLQRSGKATNPNEK